MRAALALALSVLAAGAAAAKERPRPFDPTASEACPQYGAGFVQVPGTSTCIRIGGRVRSDYVVTSGRRSVSRDRSSGFSPSGSVSADVRTDTAAGPLRAYVRVRGGGGPYGGR